jgi:hypothetical protein
MAATIIIGALIAGWVVFVVFRTVRQRKRGGCSCGCSGCSAAETCHPDQAADKR